MINFAYRTFFAPGNVLWRTRNEHGPIDKPEPQKVVKSTIKGVLFELASGEQTYMGIGDASVEILTGMCIVRANNPRASSASEGVIAVFRRLSFVEASKEMADFTSPLCAQCPGAKHNPDRCCDPMYCEIAKEAAEAAGVILEVQDHPRLPYMGPSGCVVPPHLRVLCTSHHCGINAIAAIRKPNERGMGEIDVAATNKYFLLRDAMNTAPFCNKSQN